MSKPVPTVRKYMTPCPETIGRTQPMSVAHRLMRERHIRHLPVLDAGRIVGVVSDRDLRFIETLRDVDPEKVTVDEAMSPDPYVVGPDSALDSVVSTMAARKYGSAIVADDGQVVGIFTTVDACTAFAELLQAPSDG